MENKEQYASLTASEHWEGICKLNGIKFDAFATKKEYTRLSEHLEPGEIVYAHASGMATKSVTPNGTDGGLNSWLVVLTSERFLFLDCAMLSKAVDSQSIRLNRVQAVSSSQGWVFGKIMVDIGSRVVTIDNCKKESVKVIADIANKLLRQLESQAVVEVKPVEEDLLAKLDKLVALHKASVLTDEEFATAKGKILSQM